MLTSLLVLVLLDEEMQLGDNILTSALFLVSLRPDITVMVDWA